MLPLFCIPHVLYACILYEHIYIYIYPHAQHELTVSSFGGWFLALLFVS